MAERVLTTPDLLHPGWRTELLWQGLAFARQLITEAGALTSLPVQAVISLQSAEGEADPEIDFATGAAHVYVIRSERDDASSTVERSTQPTRVMTGSS